jgi:Spy/CpxP family protein refolding chaperone
MLLAEVAQVGLRPEQQAVVDSIQADLDKQTDALKEPRTQLSNDLADGVASGRLDKTKIDGDSKKLAQAAESTVKAVQDAANKLHQTLDAGQRKKLVELIREKTERMHQQAMGPMHGPGMSGPGMGGHGMGGHGMGPRADAPGVAPKPAPGMDQRPGANVGTKPEAPASPKGASGAGMGPNGVGDRGMSPGHHGAGPDVMGHPGMHAHMGIDRLSDILALTPEQRDKLKIKSDALMKSQMSAMKTVHATMQKRLSAIADAFMTDKFDAKKAGIGDRHGDMLRSMVKARVEFVELILSVLTPDQRTKFAEHIRQHCEVCDESE